MQDSLLQAQLKHCPVSLDLTKDQLLQHSHTDSSRSVALKDLFLFGFLEERREMTFPWLTFENCYLSLLLIQENVKFIFEGVKKGMEHIFVLLRCSASYR